MEKMLANPAKRKQMIARAFVETARAAKLALHQSFSHQPLVVGSKAMDLCSYTCVERKIENIELDERPIARNPGLKMRIPCSRPRIANSSVEIAFI